MLNFLESLYTCFSHYKRIFKIFKGFNAPSYSIGKGKIKSKPSQLIDYLYIFFVLKFMPSNYHLFCFDTKNRKEFKRYIGNTVLDHYTKRKFKILWRDNNLIHDKYIFKVICEHHNLPVPMNFGKYRIGERNKQQIDLRQLMIEKKLKTIVLKPEFGAWGLGIQFISRNELDKLEHLGSSQKGDYIIEEHLSQHPELDKINPYSVNSIRIITFLCTDDTVEFLGSMLKTSQSTLPVDNFTLGGIVIGIDMSTGKLRKEGFVKSYYSHKLNEMKATLSCQSTKQYFETLRAKTILRSGRILLRHPVTQTEFLDFQIPYWDELKEITMNAQKVFYQIKTIAWDVAVASKGPVIIEANAYWGTAGLQAANAGLMTDRNRKLFAQYGISFYA